MIIFIHEHLTYLIMQKKLPIQSIYLLYRKISFYIFLLIPILLTAQQSTLEFCVTENITTDNSIYSFSDNINVLNNFPERTFNVYFWELYNTPRNSIQRLSLK